VWALRTKRHADGGALQPPGFERGQAALERGTAETALSRDPRPRARHGDLAACAVQEHPDLGGELRPFGLDDIAAKGCGSSSSRHRSEGWRTSSMITTARSGGIAAAGYWQVFRPDRDGEAIDDGREIHAQEGWPRPATASCTRE
jgi:hypothetical protein